MTLPFHVPFEEPITEQYVRKEILKALHDAEWKLFILPQQKGHTAQTVKGWPDIVGVKNGHMLAMELKGPGKTPTLAQQEWLDVLGEIEGCTSLAVNPDNMDTVIALISTL